MVYIPAKLHAQVVARAAHRCGYCGLHQAGQEASFHIDHVLPLAAGGTTEIENLALACVSCSLRKGSRQSAIDPQTGSEVALFNPRRDQWDPHFRWRAVRLEGLTATGRATIAALEMNRPMILAIRAEETKRGRHPPAR